MSELSVKFPDDFVEREHPFSNHIKQWIFPKDADRSTYKVSIIGGTGEDIDEEYRPRGDGETTFEVYMPDCNMFSTRNYQTINEINEFLKNNVSYLLKTF